MAWIQGSNSIVCSSTAAPRVYKMLSSVEFCVVADPYMTPSAVAFADIFLPLKTTAERDSMRVCWTPLRAMNSVSEWYEAKSDEELIVALGLKLNPVSYTHLDVYNRQAQDSALELWIQNIWMG